MSIMRVNREQLLHNLQAVQPGLSPKEIIEQSGSFVFKNGEVLTYNDEVACRNKSGLDPTFTGACKAEKFIAVLEKMRDDELQVEVGEGELILKGKRGKAGLRLEKEITLPIGNVEKPKDWSKLHEDFAEAINVVQQCAGKDESQFALCCVHLHPKWVEGCDNFQLCRWKMATGVKAPTLVRQSSIRHITILGMTEFCETESWIHFRNPSGMILSCRRFMEDFPTLSKLLDVTGEPAVLPKGLEEAVGRADIFSSENAEDNQVMINLSPGKVTVKGEGTSGWYRETKKIKYQGESLAFRISPKLLGDLVKKHSECVISPDRLKVDGGSYTYVTCLSKSKEVEDNGDVSE